MDSWYLAAFYDLSTCRAVGMSIGPIPWTAINDYAERIELDGDSRDLFVFVIRRMDAAYLEWTAAETERKSRTKGKK